MSRSYSELMRLRSFEERFEYLKLNGSMGISTFGFDRYLNQYFYTSYAWRQVRQKIIIRDGGCDLAIPERVIFGNVRVHHMNPLTMEDLENERATSVDPEFLICVSLNTHNAIHFGSKDNLYDLPKDRKRGDTTPWKVF